MSSLFETQTLASLSPAPLTTAPLEEVTPSEAGESSLLAEDLQKVIIDNVSIALQVL